MNWQRENAPCSFFCNSQAKFLSCFLPMHLCLRGNDAEKRGIFTIIWLLVNRDRIVNRCADPSLIQLFCPLCTITGYLDHILVVNMTVSRANDGCYYSITQMSCKIGCVSDALLGELLQLFQLNQTNSSLNLGHA